MNNMSNMYHTTECKCCQKEYEVANHGPAMEILLNLCFDCSCKFWEYLREQFVNAQEVKE